MVSGRSCVWRQEIDRASIGLRQRFWRLSLRWLSCRDASGRRPAAAGGSTPAGGVTAVPAANKEPAKNPIETAASLFREPKVEHSEHRQGRRTTGGRPSVEQWWDKPAPDFTLTDIEGQAHKLSDYRGKNVVISCLPPGRGPDKVVVPPLKELRSAYPKDSWPSWRSRVSRPPGKDVRGRTGRQFYGSDEFRHSAVAVRPGQGQPNHVLRWCRRQVQDRHRRNGSDGRRQGNFAGTVDLLIGGGGGAARCVERCGPRFT